MNEPIDGLAAGAAVRLRDLAGRVVGRRPTKTHNLWFDLSWLADQESLQAIEHDLKQVVTRDERAIYQFSCRDPAAYDALRTAYNKRPPTKDGDVRELNYSRLMAPENPQALYVGSGRDLRTRVSQHVGRIGGPGTYGMRLALWATGIEAIVDLDIWLYERELNPIELEALEQELWDARTPLLGKRSGK
jgi:hypothetical protein